MREALDLLDADDIAALARIADKVDAHLAEVTAPTPARRPASPAGVTSRD